MGKTKGIYNIEFPVGSKVQIADLEHLRDFQKTWAYHHRLLPEQLNYHDEVATVEEASFYHGGDELYRLTNIPGIWHEACLRPSH
jgi:hypothetical protein